MSVFLGGNSGLELPLAASVTGAIAAAETALENYADTAAGNARDEAIAYVQITRDPDQVLIYREDFLEAPAALGSAVVVDAYWTGGGTDGTREVVATNCGNLRLQTTVTANRTSTATGSSAYLDLTLSPSMEFRAVLSEITNEAVNFGLRVDASDYAMFRFDTAVHATRIDCITNNDAGGVDANDSGVEVDTDYHIYKIQLNPNGSVDFYIDDLETPVHTTAADAVRAVEFLPYFYIDNKAAAQDNGLDIDYVEIRQARPA